MLFDLEGQGANAAACGRVAQCRPGEVGAPMPGTVATINVMAGHAVARGDVLVTLEAMKMETSVRAERDGTVTEVVAKPGEQVDAKDLLLVIA